MELKNYIGAKVISQKGEVGVVVKAENDKITAKYVNRRVDYSYNQFLSNSIKFEDDNLQKKIEEEIRLINNTNEQLRFRNQMARRFDDAFNFQFMDTSNVMTYREVENYYSILRLGPGRGINVKDEYIILISNIEKKRGEFNYHDNFTNDNKFIYSGEGLIGDQSLDGGNLEIVNSKENNKKLILIIKESSTKYYVQGEWKYESHYEDTEEDSKHNLRKVYKFVLVKA